MKNKKIIFAILIYSALYPVNFLMAFFLGQEKYTLGIMLMFVAIVFEGLSVYYCIGAQTEDIRNEVIK